MRTTRLDRDPAARAAPFGQADQASVGQAHPHPGIAAPPGGQRFELGLWVQANLHSASPQESPQAIRRTSPVPKQRRRLAPNRLTGDHGFGEAVESFACPRELVLGFGQVRDQRPAVQAPSTPHPARVSRRCASQVLNWSNSTARITTAPMMIWL